MIPIEKFRSDDIREIREPGIMRTARPSGDFELLTLWDDTMYGVLLTGSDAFKYFPIDIRTVGRGMFVARPMIVADMSSAARLSREEEDAGKLVVSGGQSSILASRAGEARGSLVNVPLWQSTTESVEEVEMGFAEWGVGFETSWGFEVIWSRGQGMN